MVGFLHWLMFLWGPQAGPLSYGTRTVEYATHAGVKLEAEIIRPADDKVYPGVLMVHGGGWSNRTREDMTKISEYLAGHGLVVMNISYRLAPKFLYPAQIEDLSAAHAWLLAHAAEVKVDPSRLAGWGYSAGGHLISQWALLESEKRKSPVLKAVVAGGTPFDLAWYPFSPIITKLLDGFRDQRPKEYKEASPVNHVGPWAPPFFLYHGEDDRLVEAVQSSHMQNLLREQGVEAQLHLTSFWGHIGTFLWDGAALQAGQSFLLDKLK